MNTKNIPSSVIFVMLIVVAGVAALYIGFKTYSRYPNIVQGIQGLATLYLIYLFYFPPKNYVRKPVGVQLEFPRVIKYIFPDFFLYIIIAWSIQYLIDSVSFFLAR